MSGRVPFVVVATNYGIVFVIEIEKGARPIVGCPAAAKVWFIRDRSCAMAVIWIANMV